MTAPSQAPTQAAPIVGTGSGVVVKTSETQNDSYKTEFVKVYQDAGVIGASMLTLLVLCFLLGMFCLRLLKMYSTLTESRDKLENTRLQYSERLTESLLGLRADLQSVASELTRSNDAHTDRLEELRRTQNKMFERLDRLRERKDQ